LVLPFVSLKKSRNEYAARLSLRREVPFLGKGSIAETDLCGAIILPPSNVPVKIPKFLLLIFGIAPVLLLGTNPSIQKAGSS